MTEITIPLRSHDEAILVLGPYDRHAKLLREDLAIDISTRRGNLKLAGEDEGVQEARRRIEHLLGKTRKGRELPIEEIEAILLGTNAEARAQAAGNSRLSSATRRETPYRVLRHGPGNGDRPGAGEAAGFAAQRPRPASEAPMLRSATMRPILPRTETQRRYLEQIQKNALVFGFGPAGTGKTYLAVASAIQALRTGQCRRLVLTRPVVEAGERLGFLPGDLQAKLNPYMRPIYDALFDLLDFEEVVRLEETGVIEVAPLAYMRGRTLGHAFAILDEGQNTTLSQMKMFLTRMGEGSRMVVTGDPSQNDLESGQKSGLNDAIERLRGHQDIAFTEFTARDIVRHPLVERIVRAYEAPARERREAERRETDRRGPPRGGEGRT